MKEKVLKIIFQDYVFSSHLIISLLRFKKGFDVQ
jgi:hypothetical protein